MSGDEASPLLDGPVTPTLLRMSGPISLGMLSTFLFQVVDTYFVGQLGPDALAALSFAATTYFLAVALFMGMAVGVSALVGRAQGENDPVLAARYATVSLGVALTIALALCAAGLWLLEPTFTLLGAPAALIPLISAYMSTLYYGLPLLILTLVGIAAIRASGEVVPQMLVMMTAGIINVVFDYVLIFGIGPFPEWGLFGAAVATVASWVFAALAIGVLFVRRRLFTLRRGDLAKELRDIASLSSPAIATQILLPVTAALITYLAARSGPEVVAGLGVAQRVETLGLVGVSAVTLAIVPFVAQNHGAGLRARVDAAIAFTGKTVVYWGGGLFLLLVLLADPIASFFSDDAAIIEATKLYFYVVAASYAPYGLVMMTAAVFNGLQRPRGALQVLLVKSFLFTAPLAIAGSFFGAWGVFAAISLSNLLGAVYAAWAMRRELRRSHSALADRRPIDDYVADWRGLAARITPGRTDAPP